MIDPPIFITMIESQNSRRYGSASMSTCSLLTDISRSFPLPSLYRPFSF